MNIIASILLPFLESFGGKVQYDAGFFPGGAAIGVLAVFAVIAGIIFLIVLAVKLLSRLRKDKTKRD